MAALSHAGVLFVMTHDSIGLGEDGPTHQPIEHLMSFRCMPNVLMLRPGDGNETAGAYKVRSAGCMAWFMAWLWLDSSSGALPASRLRTSQGHHELLTRWLLCACMRLGCMGRSVRRRAACACIVPQQHLVHAACRLVDAAQVAVENARAVNKSGKRRPSIMAFSRQGMPNLPGSSIDAVAKGGYIVHGGDAKPDVILLATGLLPGHAGLLSSPFSVLVACRAATESIPLVTDCHSDHGRMSRAGDVGHKCESTGEDAAFSLSACGYCIAEGLASSSSTDIAGWQH